MRQVLQNLKTGSTDIAEVPCPVVKHGQLLLRSTCTLVSTGTERMLVEFGKANWLQKARQQPDKVRMAVDKVRTDGAMATLQTVLSKLDQPVPLGYCNVGVAISLGDGVEGFSAGDRVVSNGNHAEVVSVPVNLCAKVPDGVPNEEAVFAVIGAIGLQGIRLVAPTLGEAVVVSGLGLIGLLTVQLLRAHGCRVLGIDFSAERLAMARRFGAETVNLANAEDPLAAAQAFSRGRGVDAVLITTSTKSNEPVHQAAMMCRKRGRIVLVGVAGLELSRADFYDKELSFQVSCSYGPGRYDRNYEQEGHDYPIGFVRWTEKRNLEAVLDMMADGRLDVKPLISHRFAIAEAQKAYDLIRGSAPSLGILIQYPTPQERPETDLRRSSVSLNKRPVSGHGRTTVAFIGSGNYASTVLIPAFKQAGARLKAVVSNGGVSGLHAGRKFGFEHTTTETGSIFDDADTDAVIITTRHDSHARLAEQALSAGKHVFVEKPLALTLEELNRLEKTYSGLNPAPILMVGFNRRFAPHVQKIKSLLQPVKGPKAFVMTVNAGAIPADHWTQDPSAGGGRVVGEACHFIDLLRFLAGSAIAQQSSVRMPGATADTLNIELAFADGSVGTIHYFANGSKSFPKERLEIFATGRVLQLDNFRKLRGYGWPGFAKMNLWRQDKGQRACAAAFLHAVERGGEPPIEFRELLEVSRVTIEAARQPVA